MRRRSERKRHEMVIEVRSSNHGSSCSKQSKDTSMKLEEAKSILCNHLKKRCDKFPEANDIINFLNKIEETEGESEKASDTIFDRLKKIDTKTIEEAISEYGVLQWLNVRDKCAQISIKCHSKTSLESLLSHKNNKQLHERIRKCLIQPTPSDFSVTDGTVDIIIQMWEYRVCSLEFEDDLTGENLDGEKLSVTGKEEDNHTDVPNDSVIAKHMGTSERIKTEKKRQAGLEVPTEKRLKRTDSTGSRIDFTTSDPDEHGSKELAMDSLEPKPGEEMKDFQEGNDVIVSLRTKPDILRDLPRPSSLFSGSGHEKCLNEIHSNFWEHISDKSIKDHTLIQIVCGLGGCGKTEIMCSYVSKNSCLYKDGVYLLNGESKISLDYGFENIFEKFVRDFHKKENSPNSIKLSVLAQLNSLRNWLLVIENADDPKVIQDEVYKYGPGLQSGQVLITTRVTDGWDFLSYYKIIDVPPFKDVDSPLYLIRQTKSTTDNFLSVEEAEGEFKKLYINEREEYEALLWLGGEEGLGGLPLAAKLASKSIRKRKMSFKDFKDEYVCTNYRYEIKEDPLIGWLNVNDLNPKYGVALRKAVKDNTHEIKKLSDEKLTAILGDNKTELNKLRNIIASTPTNDFVHMPNINRKNLLTTWKKNYDEITKDECTKTFLQLCSCLTSPVEVGFLVDAGIHLKSGKSRRAEIKKSVSIFFEKVMKCSFATAATGNYFMVEDTGKKSEENGSQGQYSFHRLLQQMVFLHFMTDEEKIKCLNNVLNIFETFLFELNYDQGQDNDDKIRKRRSRIGMHTVTLSKHLTTVSEYVITKLHNTHHLFMAASKHLFWKERPDDATSLCERMVYVTKMRTPCDAVTLELATEYSQLARGYLELEKIEKSMECYTKSEEYFKRLSVPNNIDIFNETLPRTKLANQAIAGVMKSKDHLDAGQMRSHVKESLLKILEDERKYCLKDEERFTIAHALNQVGRYHEDIGDYKKGRMYLSEALKETRRAIIPKENVIEQLNRAVILTNNARNLTITDSNINATDVTIGLLEEAIEIKTRYRTQAGESYQKGLLYMALLYRKKEDREKLLECKKKLQLLYKEQLETTTTDEDIRKVFKPETLWL